MLGFKVCLVRVKSGGMEIEWEKSEEKMVEVIVWLRRENWNKIFRQKCPSNNVSGFFLFFSFSYLCSKFSFISSSGTFHWSLPILFSFSFSFFFCVCSSFYVFVFFFCYLSFSFFFLICFGLLGSSFFNFLFFFLMKYLFIHNFSIKR